VQAVGDYLAQELNGAGRQGLDVLVGLTLASVLLELQEALRIAEELPNLLIPRLEQRQ